MPYKLAIGKMTNGLLSKSASTMVLQLGQKTSPGAITPLYILKHIIRLQAVVKIITNKTTRALNFLAKQSTRIQCHLSEPLGFRLFVGL
jgi:hypothetical protein